MASITDADVRRIRGAFKEPDVGLFRHLLDATSELGGDLCELGAWFGRSAVLIGSYLQADETFTVVDLFGAEAPDDQNQRENDDSYSDLTRTTFEDNYRALHGGLPHVVQDVSAAVLDHAGHGTHRFVHVDASHLYEHVVTDVRSAQVLLKPDGIVVFDDYRAPHTPGVAAAVWPEVVAGGLSPFLLTFDKLYATWGDVDRWRSSGEDWIRATDLPWESQEIAGHPVIRVPRVAQKEHWLKKFVPPVAQPALMGARDRWGAAREHA